MTTTATGTGNDLSVSSVLSTRSRSCDTRGRGRGECKADEANPHEKVSKCFGSVVLTHPFMSPASSPLWTVYFFRPTLFHPSLRRVAFGDLPPHTHTPSISHDFGMRNHGYTPLPSPFVSPSVTLSGYVDYFSQAAGRLSRVT